jgi:peptidoglycan/LPS O-acetylase OafA/YrhL
MSRKNNFDALRLAGAFLVFVSHHCALQNMPEPSVRGMITLGGLGVFVFFPSAVISSPSAGEEIHILCAMP